MIERPHRVVVLIRDGIMPLELGIVHQIFGAAEDVDGTKLYSVITCTFAPGAVRTDADFTVQVAHGAEALADADTMIVPAAHIADETETEGRLNARLTHAFGLVRPGARIASICTGSFALAAAGLLDGRRATTHWKSADNFRRLYPAVELDPDVLYIDEGSVLTSAGEAAGIDLCLHMVRRDHGAAVANDVARRTIVPPYRDGGQAQYIPMPVAPLRSPSTLQARAWVLHNLHEPISLRDLADQESVSVRTFTRRFREEVGMPPLRWIKQQRIERARQLLETTDLPVETVARQVGFGTASSLREHFHERVGVSPRGYRKTFRGANEFAPRNGSS